MWYKVKKIYQWTNLVRPAIYEYSYDFRNKSSSQLSADWWSVLWWTLETWSSWITSPVGKDVSLWHSVDLSTAKKITIDTSIVWNRNDSYWDRAMSFWIRRNQSWASDYLQFYIASAVASYHWTVIKMRFSWTTTEWTNIGSIWTSSYTPKLILDLESKTATWKISWYNNSTYTLSDAQITAIRNMSYFYVYATQHNFYIQNISITVE